MLGWQQEIENRTSYLYSTTQLFHFQVFHFPHMISIQFPNLLFWTSLHLHIPVPTFVFPFHHTVSIRFHTALFQFCVSHTSSIVTMWQQKVFFFQVHLPIHTELYIACYYPLSTSPMSSRLVSLVFGTNGSRFCSVHNRKPSWVVIKMECDSIRMTTFMKVHRLSTADPNWRRGSSTPWISRLKFDLRPAYSGRWRPLGK